MTKILDTLDVLAGRILLPTLAEAPGSPTASQLWQIANQIFFRNAADDATVRLLSTADMGVANGVATLGTDGLVTAAQLPSELTAAVSVPIGGGLNWYGDPNSIPSAFLVRDGAEYLRTDYPELAAALRARFGRATNDLYFRVPDDIGRQSHGAWSYENSGYVRRVDIFTRGQGYTPGSYTFTFTGGTFSSAATGRVVIANETVPGVGTTGVVQRVEIVTPGEYTSTGSAASSGTAANCAVTIPLAALPGGTGFVYDIFAQPLASTRAPYAAYSVQMDNHGTSYTSPPEVVITGATLLGATGYAVVRNGGVANIVLTNPGTGSIAGATVTITGGAGSGATASLRTETRYALSGDYIGEEQHVPLLAELVAHTHTMVTNQGDGDDDGGPRRNNLNENTGSWPTDSTGSSYPLALLPSSLGYVPLIRAI